MLRPYDTLRTLAVACGLNAAPVAGVIGMARLAQATRIGSILNDAFDWMQRRGRGPLGYVAARRTSGGEDFNVASRVFADLNRQAGLDLISPRH